MAPDDRSGVIHDIGYQRYTGTRLGRGYVVRSLFTHGVRTVFGFGRGGKAKIFPWFVIGVLFLIATVAVAVRSQSGVILTGYLDYPGRVALLMWLFLASAAPELVSRDLRSKVLPLYFSRPLRRTDYAWAKLGALIASVWMLLAAPMLLMFLGAAFSLEKFDKIWHEFLDFLGGLALAGIYAIALGVVALLIASLINRRMLAAAVIVGFFLVTQTVGLAIGEIIGDDRGRRVGMLFSPPSAVQGLEFWLYRISGNGVGGFGPAYLVEVVLLTVIGSLLLVQRYRKVAA